MRKIDHDQRREEVAAAAARLIARRGLENLTTRALAKELGCSIGVLSHYFNSKEDIVIAAFQWADHRIDERVEEVLRENPSLDSFFPLIRAALPLTEETDLEWRVRMALYNYSLTCNETLAVQRQKIDTGREQLGEMLRALQEKGEVRRDLDPARMIRLIVDLVFGSAQSMLMMPMKQRERYAAYLFELVGFMRPPPPPR